MDSLLQTYQAHAFWFWVGLGAALLAIEVLTGTGWLLWAAATAAVVGVAAMLGLPPAYAILLYAGLTIVSTLLARRYVPKSLQSRRHDINDNVARLIGHRGMAVGPFDGRLGRVFIDGKEWAAELDGDPPLAPGAQVQVVAVDGARLRVRPA